MSDLQDRLAALRRRMAQAAEACDEKYGKAKRPYFSGFSRAAPESFRIQEWFPGTEIETAHGKHFEAEMFYARHRRHGSAELSDLSELPPHLLETLSRGAARNIPPQQWAFLDTETTGLTGGGGTCAFLAGVGRITADGFYIRQFFMRAYGEEASQLDALSRHLESFRVVITYNGRTFDQPLLETRYSVNRTRSPFTRLEHLDLLHGARNLWKLRFERCRLADLERHILGLEREGDVAGAMIPYIYFDYVRTGEMARLLPVFHHNALDILTLACLTGIVPYAFNDPARAPLRHGTEMAALGRWVSQSGQWEQARTLFRRAVDAGLPDPILFRALWDIGALERKLGCEDAALSVWNDLAVCPNPFRMRALEELAKHYEHRAKDYAQALEFTRSAIALGSSAGLRKREERLAKRVVRKASKYNSPAVAASGIPV